MGPTIVVVLAKTTTACPTPFWFAVKMAGDAGARLMVSVLLVPAGVVTCTVADEPVTSNGTCALICPGATKNSGALVPLNVTLTPRSDVGSGSPPGTANCEMKLLPKIERIAPGAAGASPSKDAPFTVPLVARLGGGVPDATGVATAMPESPFDSLYENATWPLSFKNRPGT